MKKIFFTGLLFLSLLTLSVMSNAQTGIKKIVIVHGAFADGCGWQGVTALPGSDAIYISKAKETAGVIELAAGSKMP